MDYLWFYIAVALAISDMLHSHVMWKIFNNFYIILAGLIHSTVHSPIQTWVIHELIESIFHFCVLSILFLSLEVGFIAALIHLVIDISHTILIKDLPPIPHRAMHFIIESVFFILIFGL